MLNTLEKLARVGLMALFIATIFGYVSFWVFVSVLLVAALIAFILRSQIYWRGSEPYADAIVHVNAHMAVRPTILKHTPPDGYRLACLYFGSGLIDRTGMLDHGFRYDVFDQIPVHNDRVKPFEDLCDRRAHNIVQEARRRNLQINLLWSGGIDSTTACIALMRATKGQSDRLRVFLSKESRKEYPLFFKEHLSDKIKVTWIDHVGEAYKNDGLVVTGELGDQLFGSAKALEVPVRSLLRPMAEAFPGPLRRPWEDELYGRLKMRLASEQRAHAVLDYLSPQINAAPVAVEDLFTCLWWMNFSLKWQPVSLRMINATRNLTLSEFRSQTAHFFQTDDFQQWALKHAGQGVREDWTTYKWAARDYIYAFTGDQKYHAEKAKLPSLRGLMNPAEPGAALAIGVGGDMLRQEQDHSLRERQSGESGVEISFERGREDQLWDDLDDGE